MAQVAIETVGLRKSFGAVEILRGVDLSVSSGAITTLLGPSGTGKSVLLKIALGLLRPDEGRVLVNGQSLDGMSAAELASLRRRVGVMFQDGALFSSMTVAENVGFPLRQHTDLREHEIREAVAEHLDAVGLGAAAGRYPAELSGGMRKRAGLARALVLQPPIVLCDEPDSGLDPVRTSRLGELLMERHAEAGGSMLIVTHDIALARLVSDHVAVIWQGRIVEVGSAPDVFASERPFVRQFLSGSTTGPLAMD